MMNGQNLKLTKIPEITLIFWIIKILATTLGETGGDVLSMSMNLGYLLSTAIFSVLFFAAVYWQMRSTQYNSAIYWTTIIATTMVGTTLADFADRSLGIGYTGGSLLLLGLLVGCIFAWYKTTGSVSIRSINSPTTERFYWLTIMLSQTLGTALGDWTADTAGLGYLGAAIIFGGALTAVAMAHFYTKISPTLLFWLAFILTRPLGAVVGDFLDKPITKGGLELSRYSASAALLGAIILLLYFFKQHAAARVH